MLKFFAVLFVFIAGGIIGYFVGKKNGARISAGIENGKEVVNEAKEFIKKL